MQLSKKQWFGIITFLFLILAAYLVTKEPWELSTRVLKSSPASNADTLYSFPGFDLGYIEKFEQASWVAYVQTRGEIQNGEIAMNKSFNNGVWNKLEAQVREWAMEKDSLYVINGPVLNQETSDIGANGLGIPGSYFKVLVDLSPPSHSFIAFLVPNADSTADLLQFAITVDSLEQVTGYNFFASAPDQEKIGWMEKQVDLDSWN